MSESFYDGNGETIIVFDAFGNLVSPDDVKVSGTNVQELLKTGMLLNDINSVEGKDIHYMVVPDGCHIERLDLSKLVDEIEDRRKVREDGKPLRNTGTVDVSDVDSFVALVTREALPETIVYASLNKTTFVAIINAPLDGNTGGFCDRKISLGCESTLEFARWMAKNEQRLTQLQLADFLEENLENIVEPPAAEVVEMISNLKVKRNASYHSVIDTKTGEQAVTFQEVIKGETLNGNLEFRSKFKIEVHILVGGRKYEIDCNLRFSVDEERLRVFFKMVNIMMIKEHAFNAENDKVRTAMADLGVEVFNVK